MDILTLIIGLVIGILFGFIVAWMWASANAKTKYKANNASEAELKALLAQQAQNHLHTSKTSLNTIERELSALRQSLDRYDQTLNTPESDEAAMPFYGEHASVFLRNNTQIDSADQVDATSDAQPKDFANNGSGLFAGSSVLNTADDSATKSASASKEKVNI